MYEIKPGFWLLHVRISLVPSSGQRQKLIPHLKPSHCFTVYLCQVGDNMKITFDAKEIETINTSFASDWAGCGCGEGGPGIPGTLGTTVTGLTS